MPGYFTISFDYELHWAYPETPLQQRLIAYQRTPAIVDRLLELFIQNNIHATWATVGSIMLQNAAEWKSFAPHVQPSYQQSSMSVYHLLQQHQQYLEQYPEAFFNSAQVQKIAVTHGQELATHTFSHYYCNAAGQTLEQFRADLLAAKTVAQHKGYTLTSIAFPRHQVSTDYLQTAFECGIQRARVLPIGYYRQSIKNPLGKFLVEKLLPSILLINPLSYTLPNVTAPPVQMPFSQKLPLITNAADINSYNRRIHRVLMEITHAAKHNKCYHLYWHPEDFGFFPEENFTGLGKIIARVKDMQKKYDMKMVNMQELSLLMGTHPGT